MFIYLKRVIKLLVKPHSELFFENNGSSLVSNLKYILQHCYNPVSPNVKITHLKCFTRTTITFSEDQKDKGRHFTIIIFLKVHASFIRIVLCYTIMYDVFVQMNSNVRNIHSNSIHLYYLRKRARL